MPGVRVNGLWVYGSAATAADLLDRQAGGESVRSLAACLPPHALALVTAGLAARAVEEGAPRTVCLGGGRFVNRRLLTEVRPQRAQGLKAPVGGEVRSGGGDISYGHAAVAATRPAKDEVKAHVSGRSVGGP